MAAAAFEPPGSEPADPLPPVAEVDTALHDQLHLEIDWSRIPRPGTQEHAAMLDLVRQGALMLNFAGSVHRHRGTASALDVLARRRKSAEMIHALYDEDEREPLCSDVRTDRLVERRAAGEQEEEEEGEGEGEEEEASAPPAPEPDASSAERPPTFPWEEEAAAPTTPPPPPREPLIRQRPMPPLEPRGQPPCGAKEGPLAVAGTAPAGAFEADDVDAGVGWDAQGLGADRGATGGDAPPEAGALAAPPPPSPPPLSNQPPSPPAADGEAARESGRSATCEPSGEGGQPVATEPQPQPAKARPKRELPPPLPLSGIEPGLELARSQEDAAESSPAAEPQPAPPEPEQPLPSAPAPGPARRPAAGAPPAGPEPAGAPRKGRQPPKRTAEAGAGGAGAAAKPAGSPREAGERPAPSPRAGVQLSLEPHPPSAPRLSPRPRPRPPRRPSSLAPRRGTPGAAARRTRRQSRPPPRIPQAARGSPGAGLARTPSAGLAPLRRHSLADPGPLDAADPLSPSEEACEPQGTRRRSASLSVVDGSAPAAAAAAPPSPRALGPRSPAPYAPHRDGMALAPQNFLGDEEEAAPVEYAMGALRGGGLRRRAPRSDQARPALPRPSRRAAPEPAPAEREEPAARPLPVPDPLPRGPSRDGEHFLPAIPSALPNPHGHSPPGSHSSPPASGLPTHPASSYSPEGAARSPGPASPLQPTLSYPGSASPPFHPAHVYPASASALQPAHSYPGAGGGSPTHPQSQPQFGQRPVPPQLLLPSGSGVAASPSAFASTFPGSPRAPGPGPLGAAAHGHPSSSPQLLAEAGRLASGEAPIPLPPLPPLAPSLSPRRTAAVQYH
eukprot:tig00000367_g24452.t1